MKKTFILISVVCLILLVFTLAFSIYSIVSPQETSMPIASSTETVATVTPEVQIPKDQFMVEPSFKTPVNADPNGFYIQDIEIK